MQLLSIVMTHREARETVKRHLPYWLMLGGDLYFTSPEDSPMNIEKEILIGAAEHHGEISAQRIIDIFKFALHQDWTHILLMEYDSFALELPEEVFPEPGGVAAAKYKQNKPMKFKGKFYLHYPMFFTREGFQRTYENLARVKSNDRLFSDRFIARAVEISGIPVKDLIKNKRAFSKNTIEPKHYVALKKAVQDGAVFFHGVKTTEVLNIITQNEDTPF